MAEQRRLIIVVEGTQAVGLHWRTIYSDYLRNMIRSFCGGSFRGQTHYTEMSLVVFKAPGSSECLVQRSGWTRDMNIFLYWLKSISFTDCGFGDVALGEGLSEALMMFSLYPNGGQVHKHCILVGASDPYPFATPVYRPQISKLDQREAEIYLADSEMVAKTFAQCFISLSVISPNQLPKLKAIYEAGKSNPGAAVPSVDTIENPQFLILLSETFKEACAELSHLGPPQTFLPLVIAPPTSVHVPRMSQENLSGQVGQSRVGMNQNKMNGPGALSIYYGAGVVMPSPGMCQQGHAGMQPLGVTNSSTANMPLPQQTSGASDSGAPDPFVRVWKGAVYGTRQGRPASITEHEEMDAYLRDTTMKVDMVATLQRIQQYKMQQQQQQQQQHSLQQHPQVQQVQQQQQGSQTSSSSSNSTVNVEECERYVQGSNK